MGSLSIAEQLAYIRRCSPCPHCKSGGYCAIARSDKRVKGVGKPKAITLVYLCPLGKSL